MFTGIVQAVASVSVLVDRPGLRSFTLAFPAGFCALAASTGPLKRATTHMNTVMIFMILRF